MEIDPDAVGPYRIQKNDDGTWRAILLTNDLRSVEVFDGHASGHLAFRAVADAGGAVRG